jgi:hypothetical protein
MLSIPRRTALSIAAAAILWTSVALCEEPKVASGADQERILAAVASVRKAILAQDTAALLATISRVEPLACTDTPYSRHRVAAFLCDPTSHLYISLFDTPAFAKRCGREYPPEYPAISEREFLLNARESVQVGRVTGGWVTVTLTSPVPTHYPREWYFHSESGGWRLAGGSLIIGRCSCG